MSDHADIVKRALSWCEEGEMGNRHRNAALAALDALVAEIRSLNEQVVGAVDLLESAVAERDKLREALTDFAEHGTRFDCNPTVIVHNTPEWVASQEWWQNRAVQMDTAVRNRARAALAPTKEGT
jgi:hypothetical protein